MDGYVGYSRGLFNKGDSSGYVPGEGLAAVSIYYRSEDINPCSLGYLYLAKRVTAYFGVMPRQIGG